MQVTLIINYFVHEPQWHLKTEVKLCDIKEALMYVAELKAKGYDITQFHYGIYKGDIKNVSGKLEEVSSQYELPVIEQTPKEEIQAMWRRFKNSMGLA